MERQRDPEEVGSVTDVEMRKVGRIRLRLNKKQKQKKKKKKYE